MSKFRIHWIGLDLKCKFESYQHINGSLRDTSVVSPLNEEDLMKWSFQPQGV